MKRIKQFGKEAMVLTATGIGLSAISPLDSTGSTAKISGSLGILGSLSAAKAGLGIVSDINKDMKNKMKKRCY